MLFNNDNTISKPSNKSKRRIAAPFGIKTVKYNGQKGRYQKKVNEKFQIFRKFVTIETLPSTKQ